MSLRTRLLTVLLLLATALAARPPVAAPERPFGSLRERMHKALPALMRQYGSEYEGVAEALGAEWRARVKSAEGLAVDFIAWRSADEERSG